MTSRLRWPGDPFEDGSDHRVISMDGWYCDTCGRPVNGQTDEDGTPTIAGDSVYHVPGKSLGEVIHE
jgi:hypothetical protein